MATYSIESYCGTVRPMVKQNRSGLCTVVIPEAHQLGDCDTCDQRDQCNNETC
jgi:hypothetical protein